MASTSFTDIGWRSAEFPANDETDAQILERFIDNKDDRAFAEIVRRHGAMVLGVCQRIVQNPHDAEDCFQAAFLVLVRKGESIVPRAMVGNWLYGVAYRTALEARKMAAKRRTMERKMQEMPTTESSTGRWEELRPALDREVSRLPDDFRAVLVLCDLEGKTRAEVARELGVPEGTVASRLARARALLAKRLLRYSLAMSSVGLATILADAAAEAEVPAWLAESTVDAAERLRAGSSADGIVSSTAAELADIVVRTLAVSKLKAAVVGILVLIALGIGVSAFIPSAFADRKPDMGKIEMRDGIEPPMVGEAVDGLIDAVSESSITIDYDDGRSRLLKEYDVDGKLIVHINGKKANLGDLKKKMKVTLYVSPHKPVKEIKVQASGVAIDARKKLSDQMIGHAEPVIGGGLNAREAKK